MQVHSKLRHKIPAVVVTRRAGNCFLQETIRLYRNNGWQGSNVCRKQFPAFLAITTAVSPRVFVDRSGGYIYALIQRSLIINFSLTIAKIANDTKLFDSQSIYSILRAYESSRKLSGYYII